MRIGSAIIALLALCILSGTSSAQSTPQFQSVSGEFAQQWMSNYTTQNPQAIQQEERSENGSDLWNWGKAPKGSAIVGGKLETDPYYLHPWLNFSSNWLGESYTDPDTGLPVTSYIDPVSGDKYYVYLNPKTGETYFTFVVPRIGKPYYLYMDPATETQVKTSVSPFGTGNALSGSLTQ
jgi:hypothetical protein